MTFFFTLLILIGLSFALGYGVLMFTDMLWRKISLLDRPHLYHTERGRDPVPYGIGIAIISTLLILAPALPLLFSVSPSLEHKLHIIIILASIIGVVSFVDDLDTIGKSRLRVPPIFRLIMQIGVGVIIGLTSIKISYISGLFGGIIDLSQYFFSIEIFGKLYLVYIIPLILTVVWYVLVFNSINFSDGIPGLTGGYALIAFMILAGLALKLYLTDTTEASQENSQFILMILAILIPVTFLVTRRDISRRGIMGDSGTIILAFFIATLSIVVGGKIATAMSVTGIYLIDFIYVITIRILKGKNPMKGDQTHHLHFRLLELGLSHSHIRMIIYSLSLTFGLAAIFLDTKGKVILFVFIALITLFMTKILTLVRKK